MYRNLSVKKLYLFMIFLEHFLYLLYNSGIKEAANEYL